MIKNKIGIFIRIYEEKFIHYNKNKILVIIDTYHVFCAQEMHNNLFILEINDCEMWTIYYILEICICQYKESTRLRKNNSIILEYILFTSNDIK